MNLNFEEIEFTNDVWCVALPIILCFLDVATGYIAAWKNKEVSSQRMRDGLSKKFGEIVLCILGWLAYLGFGLKIAATFLTTYVVVMEITSIVENVGKLDVPIPKFIKERLKALNDIFNKEEWIMDDEKIEEITPEEMLKEIKEHEDHVQDDEVKGESNETN